MAKTHSLVLEGREKLLVTGVEDAESFDDTELIVHTAQGVLRVGGSDLHVEQLDLETGDLKLSGLVSALDYVETEPSGSLWTRLFR